MSSLTLEIHDNASPALSKLIDLLDNEGRRDLNEIGARAGASFLKEYHRDFSANGGWTNPALPTHGPGRKSSRFGEDVARAWLISGVDGEGFTLSNNATGFAHKVNGGTITAKKASALTIPMVPAAHGVRARDYPNRLFRPNGKDYLMENVNGEGRVVYLLRNSVTHQPWEGALPPMSSLLDTVVDAMSDELLERIDDAT